MRITYANEGRIFRFKISRTSVYSSFFRHYFTWRIIKSYRSIDIRRYLLAIRIINPSCYNAFVVSSRRNSLYVYRLLNFIHSSLNYYSIFFLSIYFVIYTHSLTYFLLYDRCCNDTLQFYRLLLSYEYIWQYENHWKAFANRNLNFVSLVRWRIISLNDIR